MADETNVNNSTNSNAGGGGIGPNAANNAAIQNSSAPNTDNTTQQKANADNSGKGEINNLETAMSVITDLRSESAARRIENKELKDRLEKLEKGGQKTDDTKSLKADLDGLRSELKAERLVNKFTKAATKAGADVDLAFAYLKGNGSLDGLDPDEASFEKDVTAIINSAIKSNSKLKADQPTPRSGSHFPGGDNSGKKPSMDDILRRSVAAKRVRI